MIVPYGGRRHTFDSFGLSKTMGPTGWIISNRRYKVPNFEQPIWTGPYVGSDFFARPTYFNRKKFAKTAENWVHQLTPAARAGWNAYAASRPIIWEPYSPRTLTGFEMWCFINKFQTPFIMTHPGRPNWIFGPSPGVVSVGDAFAPFKQIVGVVIRTAGDQNACSSAVLTLSNPPGSVANVLIIYSTAPYRGRYHPWANPPIQLQVFPGFGFTTPPVDFTTAYSGIVGHAPAGWNVNIGVRCINGVSGNGIPDPLQIVKTIILEQ